MKLLSLALMLMLCTLCRAISFSTIATVSMTLVSLNKPAAGFFGMFRRRQSPAQETVVVPETQDQFPFTGQRPMSGGFFNRFGGFGGGNMFFPGFNTPSFGMFGQNRFPPQFRPPQQMKPPQLPQRPRPQLPVETAFSPQQQFHEQLPMQFPPQSFPSDFDMGGNFRDPRVEDDVPGMNTEEAESFFTLLSETDESKCISRLVCEMGANPESGGEFGQTIAEIIGSLKDFPDGSKVSEYNEVLNIGVAEGLSSCLSKFSMCDEESYQLVKKAQVDDDG